MKHYKDAQNNLYAYEADGSQDSFILPGLIAITEAEANTLRAPAAVVPQVVTRFQARAALHLAGLLEQVEALMAHPDTPMLAKLAWSDAMEFKRASPTIASLASTLGLSDAALDDLFTVAAGIDA